jgi:hypothetical protein
MTFTLEFYVESPDRQPTFLEHFTTDDILLDEAKIQATSIMRNVKFDRALANLCVIRDMSKGVLGQVRLSSQERRVTAAIAPRREPILEQEGRRVRV